MSLLLIGFTEFLFTYNSNILQIIEFKLLLQWLNLDVQYLFFEQWYYFI